MNFSKVQIKNYFENNKNKYSEIYKSIKLLELNPENLVSENEFTDLFFKKIDEIDDLIILGEKLDQISQKFNLEAFETPKLTMVVLLGHWLCPMVPWVKMVQWEKSHSLLQHL